MKFVNANIKIVGFPTIRRGFLETALHTLFDKRKQVRSINGNRSTHKIPAMPEFIMRLV